MMPKTLSLVCLAIVLVLLAFSPSRSSANKFFTDDDFFFFKYLKQDKYALDTSAAAIVLYERRTVTIGGEKIRRIIKIIKKNGIDYADVFIPVPAGDHYVSNIHGCTYNLEGGNMVKQELDKDNIAIEQTDLIKEEKISMPSVKEGSVIDYSYEITGVNNFYKLAEWNVQEDIPKLYTRLDIEVDELYTFDAYDQSVPVFIKIDEDRKNIVDSLLPYAYTTEISGNASYWVRRNIPAFNNEPYLSDRGNYCESMYVYLRSIERYGAFAKFLKELGLSTLDTWGDINKIMVHVFLDKPLLTSEQPVKDKAREIAGSDTSDISVAKKIFRYVNSDITCTGIGNMFMNKDLAKVLKDRAGSNAEVNLLLVAMLRARGLSCSPVMVATKGQGHPRTDYPDLFKYEYLVCELRLNGEKYYLDASQQYSSFGMLPLECLNGMAWVVDRIDSGRVMLTPGMAKEKALFSVTTTNSAATDYTLTFKYYYGDREAVNYRKEWNKDTTQVKKYISSLFKDLSFDVRLKQYSVQHMSDPDGKLELDFTIGYNWPSDAATVYFNPYFTKFFSQNPFKNASRKYPISMPYTQNYTYICKLQLPDGYSVDEVPKSGIVTIDDQMQYKNRINYDKTSNTLNIDSRLQCQRLNFSVGEYDALKEFFNKMIEEQQTSIVIKKQS